MSAAGGGKGNWGPWPVQTVGPTNNVLPGQVKVVSNDAIPGYLEDKIRSSDGSINVGFSAGPPNAVDLTVNRLLGSTGLVAVNTLGQESVITGPSVATLVFNYNLADFTGVNLTNAGLMAAATQAYGAGFGPMIQSLNGASASSCAYGLGIAATKILITGNTVRNDLSGGTGPISFHAVRNGIIVATLDIAEGAGSQDPTTLTVSATIVAGAVTDTFGLECTNGTGATAGALTGTITLVVQAV